MDLTATTWESEASDSVVPMGFSRIAEYLSSHRFREQFIDGLGWDHAGRTISVSADGYSYNFEVVAHKRGFQVLHCRTDRRTLFNRGRLRRIQREAAKQIHEHILIYSSETPRKQVWQWVVRGAGERRIRHCEHPFFSDDPPAPLMARLLKIEFTLEEEADVTLVDAIERIRHALDAKADRELFVRYPVYAEQSDALAMAVKAGDDDALNEFVEFHRPLARKFSRRLCRHFGLTLEEAEHIGTIGVMKAARRFDPDRGLQFSTYATNWIRATGQRLGPTAGLMIHIPQHVLWPCVRLRFERNELRGLRPEDFRRRLRAIVIREFGSVQPWNRFLRATTLRTLSRRKSAASREVWSRTTSAPGPLELAIHEEERERIRRAVSRLHPRHARVIQLRYGIGCPEHTLEEAGEILGVTRERVRQIQKVAEEKLEQSLPLLLPDLPVSGEGNGTAHTESNGDTPVLTEPVL